MPAVSRLTWCSRASLAAVGGSSAAAAREIFACLRRVTTLRRSAGFFAPPGLAGFRQRNRDCLLAALHLAAGTTLETSLFVFVHNLFDFALLVVLDIFISSKIDCNGNEVRGYSVPSVSLCPAGQKLRLCLPCSAASSASSDFSGRFSKTLDVSDFAARTGLGKCYQDCRPAQLIA